MFKALTAVLGATLIAGVAACGSTSPGAAATDSSSATLAAARVNAPPAPGTGPVGTCDKVRGPFHTSGVSMLTANGSPYTPYGMTVGGLQSIDYDTRLTGDLQRIDAIAKEWCSNTVRLQLRQENLIGPTANPTDFLAHVGKEVTEAEHDGLVVVLNDQTESDTNPTAEEGPTQNTVSFWRKLLSAQPSLGAPTYAQDPQVVLDVFNEPRAQGVITGCTDNCTTWRLWQQGGQDVLGHNYLGMQQLVDAVRADSTTNLLWVEGPFWAGTLSQVSAYRITGGALAYDVHHPDGAHTAAQWDLDFGYLVEGGIAPVVDGEWTNRSSGDSTNCWPDAPTAVPNYLAYLATHHIGLIAFQLVHGFMVTDDNNDFTDTTKIVSTGPIDTRWRCNDGGALDQGAGALVMTWLKANNPTPGAPTSH